MCGIVGYTGHGRRSPLVLRVSAAGIPWVRLRWHCCVGRSRRFEYRPGKAGVLANLESDCGGAPLPSTGRTGIGHTRWATHGGPDDGNAHPHMDSVGRRWPLCITASSRISGRCVPICGGTERCAVRHRHGGGGASVGREPTRDGSDRGGLRGVHGSWSAGPRGCVHPGRSPMPTFRRCWSRPGGRLAVGGRRRRRRDFVASDVSGVHRAHPGRDRTRAGPARGDSPPTAPYSQLPSTGSGRPDFTTVPGRLGSEPRQEGRIRVRSWRRRYSSSRLAVERTLRRSFRRVWDRARRAATGRWELRTRREGAHRRLRHRLPFGLVAKYAIEHWTRLTGRGRTGQRVPLSRPGLTATAGRRGLVSPARRRTPWKRCGIARRQRARVLAVCNTNGCADSS